LDNLSDDLSKKAIEALRQDPDCTDPLTGFFLASDEGAFVRSPCPACGHINILIVTKPTNRFRFTCGECGERYVLANTLIEGREPGTYEMVLMRLEASSRPGEGPVRLKWLDMPPSGEC
jgi:predicted RNA-binding Zn-ribbon protein involved in translation (DUF1610 family)